MHLKTEAKSDSCLNSASFPAKPGKNYGTSLPSDGILTLSVLAVAGGISFSVSGDLELVSMESRVITVSPTKNEGKGAITVHADEGDVTVDVTVGGDTIVGLSFLSL
jgi:hypothetical protein